MSNFPLAFGALTLIAGLSLLFLAMETSISYNYPPRGHVRWLKILLAATLCFGFLAVVTNKPTSCDSYTKADYKYGEVPVRCVK